MNLIANEVCYTAKDIGYGRDTTNKNQRLQYKKQQKKSNWIFIRDSNFFRHLKALAVVPVGLRALSILLGILEVLMHIQNNSRQCETLHCKLKNKAENFISFVKHISVLKFIYMEIIKESQN